MPCPAPALPDNLRRNNVLWENFTRTARRTVTSYFTPESLDELVFIVQRAEAEGRRLKAVGSGWSLSEIAVSGDWMVDTGRLNRPLSNVMSFPAIRLVHPGRPLETLVHVEAGIKLIELNRLLANMGVAMLTLGGSQGQQLAGAFSTSTHGSDYGQPPLADLVRAVHLVTTGGQEVWIESALFPVTDNDDLLRAALPCQDTKIIRDDEALDAVRVGLGRFGIIYSVVVSVTQAYRLAEWTQYMQWSEVAAELHRDVGAAPGLEFGSLNRILDPPPAALNISAAVTRYQYLDITFNPRRREGCWVRRRWRTTDSSDLNLASGSNVLCQHGMGALILNTAATAIAGLSGLYFWVPWKGPELTARAANLSLLSLDPHITGGRAAVEALNALWASQVFQELNWTTDEINQIILNGVFDKSMKDGLRGSSWQVTSGTAETPFDRDCFSGRSSEIIFPADSAQYLEFVNRLLAEGTKYRQLGLISVRFSHRSTALLSMHNVPHHMAVAVEVLALDGLADTSRWIQWVEATGRAMGGRPHWGQQNWLDALNVQGLYGPLLTRWRQQLVRIAGLSRTFSSDHTVSRGLEPWGVKSRVAGVRRSAGVVTHICLENSALPPVQVHDAISAVREGRIRLYTTAPDGSAEVPLESRDYLSTVADATVENNLDNLPVCPRLLFGPLLGNRHRVTSVIRYATPQQPTRYLCNEEEGWCVHVRQAVGGMLTGSHEYFVEGENREQVPIRHRTYLTTAPDGRDDNNLESLPEC